MWFSSLLDSFLNVFVVCFGVGKGLRFIEMIGFVKSVFAMKNYELRS